MNKHNIQSFHTTENTPNPVSTIFDREPFLLKEMTSEEFKKYVLLKNHEISIENVDFKPPRITV